METLHVHPFHKDAVAEVLTRSRSLDSVARGYQLTISEQEHLRSMIGLVDALQRDALRILLLAHKRKGERFFSYEDSITKPDVFSDQYGFTADLAYDYPEVFPAMDNHGVADFLREAAVFNPNEGEDDPESGCYFAYFKTEEEARGFIERLNTYLVMKSKEGERVS